MSDRVQTSRLNPHPPDVAGPGPRLPWWLARRLLRPGEEVTWVRGPRFNPAWERYLTHPALVLAALGLGAACVAAGWLGTGMDGLPAVLFLAAGAVVLASIYVVGFSSGYFTRLVVTNARLLVVQGYEVCRSWSIDYLPPSLVRHLPREGGEVGRAVDLDALTTMLGAPSDGFVDAKTILAFSKQLGRIKAREGRPPDPDRTQWDGG
jgi:hypothetical protein